MNAPSSNSALRLVGSGVAPLPRALPRGHRAGVTGRAGAAAYVSSVPAASEAQRRAVAAENAAASMSALDPRWALAVRANAMLQGGRAAILPPESRRFLVSLGKDINLRPFDANLIIAIVQDAARAGYDPLGTEAKLRLKMVREPAPVQDRPVLRWLIGALVLGSMAAWWMIRAFGA